MKRVPLALAFFVVAGTASAAIFNPPRTNFSHRSTAPLENASRESVDVSPAVTSSAPLAIHSARAPVPLPDLPKPPPLDIASVAESPPAAGRVSPSRPTPPPRATLGHAGEKEVRNLSESHCAGRPMKSITVLPDGSVHVQC
jgi:hypothetical protein